MVPGNQEMNYDDLEDALDHENMMESIETFRNE